MHKRMKIGDMVLRLLWKQKTHKRMKIGDLVLLSLHIHNSHILGIFFTKAGFKERYSFLSKTFFRGDKCTISPNIVEQCAKKNGKTKNYQKQDTILRGQCPNEAQVSGTF